MDKSCRRGMEFSKNKKSLINKIIQTRKSYKRFIPFTKLIINLAIYNKHGFKIKDKQSKRPNKKMIFYIFLIIEFIIFLSDNY